MSSEGYEASDDDVLGADEQDTAEQDPDTIS